MKGKAAAEGGRAFAQGRHAACICQSGLTNQRCGTLLSPGSRVRGRAVIETGSRLGIAGFLAEYRAVRHLREQEPGLARFLRDYREMRASLAASPQATRRPAADPAVLAGFLEALCSCCARWRQTDRISNIWAIAGLKRDAVRTTAALAWWLDPAGEHGFGNAILREVLAALGAPLLSELSVDAPYRVRTEYCAFGEATDRVDIVIDGPDFLLFIEVKIDAPEGPNQLNRYVRKASAFAQATGKPVFAVLYLSDAARPDLPDLVVPLRWRAIADAIEAVRRADDQPNSFRSQAARQFAEHVRQLHGGRHGVRRPR